MAEASEDVRVVEIEAIFRHSAGRLGSRFLAAVRDEARLLGWRTGQPARVLIPPKDLGIAGEWVAVGPGATLAAYAPPAWLRAISFADAEPADGSCLALVNVDGADTALLARLRPGPAAGGLSIGMRLAARFAEKRSGAITDFWFEPVEG